MKIVGHRGARGLAPENTIASLRQALEYGVDAIEIDVRVTADGVVILSHDPQLNRDDGQPMEIATHTHKQLQSIKADLVTLSQAAEVVHQHAPLFIEVKPHVTTTPVTTEIRKLLAGGWKSSEIMVISSRYRILRAIHQEMPGLTLGVIDRWSGVRATWKCHRVGTKTVIMDRRWLWPGFIRAVNNSGYRLYAYTVNDPAAAHKMAKHDLFGVITDYPDRFRSKST